MGLLSSPFVGDGIIQLALEALGFLQCLAVKIVGRTVAWPTIVAGPASGRSAIFWGGHTTWWVPHES